ncbi:MAG: DUF4097 family beta strand repeat-containing protein [Candidatus Cyclobacteriaceae bacterium M3_2C_046]
MKKYVFINLLWLSLVSCSVVSQSIYDQKQFSYEGIKDLTVEGAFCTVEITGQDRNDVDFWGEITGKGNSSAYAIRHEQNGEALRIWIDKPRSSWGNINGKLILKVPHQINVFLDNGSGSVRISNLRYGGLRATTGSGSLKAEQIVTNAYFKTGSGGIDIADLRGDLEVVSSSGSQHLHGILGNINSRSSSGTIRFEQVNGNVEGETSSGSVHLNDIKGSLSVRTSSGSVNGQQVLITNDSRFKTSSGSVRVDLLNDLNEFNFDLSASSGSIRVGNNSMGKKYVSNGGNISIVGVTSSGSQRYN